jgi:hypothetical protein
MNIVSRLGDCNLDMHHVSGVGKVNPTLESINIDDMKKIGKSSEIETPKASPSSVIDDRTIKFLKDEETGRTVVKFKRGDDIVHIPSEVAIKTDERIRNYLDRIMEDVLFIDLENLSTDDKIGASVDIRA